MSDDLSRKGVTDRKKINTSEPYEVDFWTRKLGVTPDKLREAVKAVGSSSDAVHKYLGKQSDE